MSETTKKTRKPKVVWSPAELKTVLDETVLVTLDCTEHLWYYIDKAQRAVLPPDRQRRIGGKHVVSDEMRALFIKLRQEFLDKKDQVPVPTPAPVPTPEPTPVPTPEPEPPRTEPQPPVLDRTAIIEGITNEELFDLLARRLAPILAGFGALINLFRTQLSGPSASTAPANGAVVPTPIPVAVPPTPPATQVVASPTPQAVPVATRPTPPQAPPTPPPAPKKTRVLIFGFASDVEGEIRRKAGNFDLELLFVPFTLGEGSPKIPTCDWAIVNDKQPLTRRADTALRARPGVEKIFRVGATEKVLQRLADINSRRS